jgi:hypothetical protein
MPWTCHSWGTTPAERSLELPCDSLIEEVDHIYHRGASIQASPGVVFRWLCQLRGGTYVFLSAGSRRLTPGLEDLAVGQSVMDAFEIVGFRRHEHLTIRTRPGGLEAKLYGDVVVSYAVTPGPEGTCRLLVRTRIRYPRILGLALRFVLPCMDLVMMRRQLRNLKKLAETSEARLSVASIASFVARRRHNAAVRGARGRATRRQRRLQFRTRGSRTRPA